VRRRKANSGVGMHAGYSSIRRIASHAGASQAMSIGGMIGLPVRM
jgi:hypothetical protein